MKLVKKGMMYLLVVMFMFFINITPVEATTTSLPEAQNGVITLTEDIELTSTYVVDNTLTIDLAGHIIYGKTAINKNYELIKINSKGNLTIKDTVGNGKITFEYIGESGNYGYYSNTISNCGILTIESGIIENTTNVSSHIFMSIDNNSNHIPAILNIKGGKVECPNYIAIRQFANTPEYINDVNVSGGTIIGGKRGIWMQSTNSKQNKASVNMTGGIVSLIYITTDSSENFSVDITGNSNVADIVLSSSNTVKPKINISGGIFGIDVTEYLADGYICPKINNKYVVATNTEYNIIVKDVEGGKAIVDKTKAQYGEKIKLEVATNEGYEFKTIEISDGKKTKKISEGEYVFDFESDVTVTPVFESLAPVVEIPKEVVIDNKTEEMLLGSLENVLKENEELATLVKNNKVEVEVVLEDIKVEDNEKEVIQKAIEEKVKDIKVAKYLDISVNVKVKLDEIPEGKVVGNLEELKEKLTFTVSIPTDLPEVEEGYSRTYYIVRNHNGVVEILDTKISEDGKSLNFDSDKFSTYALAYVDEKVENKVEDNVEVEEKKEEKDETPKTGTVDFTMYVVITLVVLVIVKVSIKRKNGKYSK